MFALFIVDHTMYNVPIKWTPMDALPHQLACQCQLMHHVRSFVHFNAQEMMYCAQDHHQDPTDVLCQIIVHQHVTLPRKDVMKI